MKIYALVDCNNFFVSCERVFQPWFNNVPTAVLSSNDGCIVARSNEVKALGIPMGAPAFKYRDVLKKHQVKQFSSNFALYGDMSRRVMNILREAAAEIEISSIDEAFLDLTHQVVGDYTAWARDLREQILQWTGMPVSIGIAPTKTLAKVANHLAKQGDGVMSFITMPPVMLEAYLMALPVGEVWGVGYRLNHFFKGYGITTAADLKNLPEPWIKARCNSTIARTIKELKGEASFAFHRDQSIQKSIASTRSFGKPVYELGELEQAVASYITSAAHKLRQQQAVTRFITVFVSTGKHAPDQRYSKALTVRLVQDTSYNAHLLSAGLEALRKIYQSGYRYKRAGIVLTGIYAMSQLSILERNNPGVLDAQHVRMHVLDAINRKWGNRTLKTAAEGLKQPWQAKHVLQSPRYTTSWSELPKVRV